ncbi:MAG: hypothetical protein SFY81_03275, partial [Verrucomicrobiota bacterium]|nr:hypothetical protein [Verrucomicrobiota bacterium]
WDLDAGLRVDAEGVRIDQDHTFNNRGNIEWAEDIQYIDHVENAAEHAISRSWVLPAGDYTINLGGNSPATSAEGRQGYKAIFKTEAASAPVGNASLTTIAFSEIGIPYGIGIAMDDEARVETLPDHVGAWSWDEDSFPETARGWTHTSKFVKLNLQQSASLTVTLSNLADVPWPSTAEPARLAGNNLFPSFTIYKGWDTDAGVQVDGEGQTIDQDHTFNNRGNIEWAEDVIYMDHLENSTEHSATKTWILPAGRYTINLGGNSPATTAEGRQGYKAVLTTTPVALVQAASADGKITFAWSESNSGYSLYSSDSVDGPWELVGGTTLTAHGRKEQSVSVSPGMKFFVLKK